MRPEGPAFNRPDRKVGIRFMDVMSAEGAALYGYLWICAAPSALFSIAFAYPDLTVGPIYCRPFGPQQPPNAKNYAALSETAPLPGR